MGQPAMVIPDGRCLRHDHSWDIEDCYQLVNGQWVMRPDAGKARCSRCRLTMREAATAMATDLLAREKEVPACTRNPR